MWNAHRRHATPSAPSAECPLGGAGEDPEGRWRAEELAGGELESRNN